MRTDCGRPLSLYFYVWCTIYTGDYVSLLSHGARNKRRMTEITRVNTHEPTRIGFGEIVRDYHILVITNRPQ